MKHEHDNYLIYQQRDLLQEETQWAMISFSDSHELFVCTNIYAYGDKLILSVT